MSGLFNLDIIPTSLDHNDYRNIIIGKNPTVIKFNDNFNFCTITGHFDTDYNIYVVDVDRNRIVGKICEISGGRIHITSKKVPLKILYLIKNSEIRYNNINILYYYWRSKITYYIPFQFIVDKIKLC